MGVDLGFCGSNSVQDLPDDDSLRFDSSILPERPEGQDFMDYSASNEALSEYYSMLVSAASALHGGLRCYSQRRAMFDGRTRDVSQGVTEIQVRDYENRFSGFEEKYRFVSAELAKLLEALKELGFSVGDLESLVRDMADPDFDSFERVDPAILRLEKPK